ncbi:MAG: TonB family protein [Myxococcales bacterium]|nr:TonB family protein [Myxococcales bacterium]
MRRDRFRWDVFAVAALVGAVLHFFVLIPRLLGPLLEKREAPVEVAYLDDTPPLESAPPLEKLASPPDTEMEKRPPEELPAEAEEAPEAKAELPTPPEPAKVEAPVPVTPVPPPPARPQERMKMVDQDRPDDEPDNADANYLAQKNHRATLDTTTANTNLVRNKAGEDRPASAPSENQAENPGEKESKVAELEQRAGREREIVRERPTPGERGETAEKSRTARGKLAMRNLTPRAAEKIYEIKPREGVELADEAAGALPRARVGEAGERARAEKAGRPRVKLTLDARDYDTIEGEAVAEKQRRDAARAERSHVSGRWDRVDKKIAAMRSSLENFTPSVRVGNQAELGTRAHPFAAYIAQMHRSIHKLWAYGFLADLDGKSASNPYNDLSLWTQLEITLKGDGTVERVTIVRPSGIAAFDVAALDSVLSSSPFSPPPESIKSVNGKVYLDWQFHRDDYQCTTALVDPHILTSVGEENRQHDTHTVDKADTSRVAPPRVLRRDPPARVAESAAEDAAPEPAGATVPDGARDAAQGWFAAYVRGDAGWLSGWSAAPFVAGGEVAAKDGEAVKRLYAALLREAPGDRRLDRFEVLTAGGVRARLGGLPPGGEGDGSMMFAVGTVGAEQFVLMLKKSDQGWRVCGLAR